MKQLFIIAALLVASVAQTGAQVYSDIGIRVGGNLSGMAMDSDLEGAVGTTSFKPGFSLGLAWDIHFTDEVYLMSGVDLVSKGYKSKLEVNTGIASASTSSTATSMYLQAPLYLAYKIAIAKDTRFVPRIGPWLSYALSGNVAQSVSAGALGFEIEPIQLPDQPMFGDEGFMKKVDYGIGLGAGLEFGRVNIYLGYELGLANLASDQIQDALKLANSEFSLKNSTISLALGYRIY